jgi:FMN-dependent NADH-azoreductase
MKTLLHLDASANVAGSVSRRLTAGFISDWLDANPDDAVNYRDLNAEAVPVVTSHLLEAIYAPPGTYLSEKQRSALSASDALVDEFLGADMFIFGVPMYNFTVPGSFKAYIDQVVRVGRTMGRGEKGLEGLVKGRKMLIISTRAGDYAKGGPREDWDFHEPYLRKIFGWMGIKDITYVPVMNSRNQEEQEKRVKEAGLLLRGTAERWNAEIQPEKAGLGSAVPTLAA